MYINDQSIRVMSFNIRNSNSDDGKNCWTNRKEFVTDLIHFHAPDLIGLQEVLILQMNDLRVALKDYDSVGIGREDGKEKGEFSAIFFVKERFELKDQGHFWLSETPDVVGSFGWDAHCVRIATWAKLLDKKTGKEFYFINTHFDHAGQVAMEQSSLLFNVKISEIAGTHPVLATGDFNDDQQSNMYKGLIENGLNDCANAPGVKSYGGNITFHGFEATQVFYENRVTERGFKTIDFILYKNHVTVLRHGILTDHINGFYPSDHMPKICDVLI